MATVQIHKLGRSYRVTVVDGQAVRIEEWDSAGICRGAFLGSKITGSAFLSGIAREAEEHAAYEAGVGAPEPRHSPVSPGQTPLDLGTTLREARVLTTLESEAARLLLAHAREYWTAIGNLKHATGAEREHAHILAGTAAMLLQEGERRS